MAQSDPNLSNEDAPIDPDLPARARARIEGERAQAEVEFRSGYKKLKAGSEADQLQETESLLAGYIHHVFFAFTEEALNSGWTAERVREKAAVFLPRLVDRTFFQKHPKARVIDRDAHRARFQDWAIFAVQNSDTWLEYQKALAELAGLDASKHRPLPGLPREALHRIAHAEKDAREHYDRDKVPYYPMHPDFSFLEDSIFRSVAWVLEFVRIFAEEVLDAHLREYLVAAPSDLLTNEALLQSVAGNVWTQTDELWKGYGCTLQFEPISRRARYMTAMAAGTMDKHPELEPWRYPEGQQWADFINRMAEPDSEMARLNMQYTATIKKVIGDRIRRYQGEAASRLKLVTGPETQREKDRAGECVPNLAKPELAGDTAPMATETESAQSSQASGADTGNSNGGDRRAAEGGFPEPDQAGAAQPGADKPNHTDVGPANHGTNPAESDGKGRKRGPKSDPDAASRVAEIVARVAPDGDWRPKLDEICEALDEAQIPFPPRWRKRHKYCDGWAAYDERANAVKAIEYRLKVAKQRKKVTPETLS